MAISLPSWAPYAVGGLALLWLLSESDEAPADRRTVKARHDATAKDLRFRTELAKAETKLATERERWEKRRQVAQERAERAAEKARKAAERGASAEARDEHGKASRAKDTVERADRKLAGIGVTEDVVEQIVNKANRGQALSAAEAEQLAVAMRGGVLRTRRNPAETLAARESDAFHCEDDQVLRLTHTERRPLPAKVVVLGALEDITYKPDGSSCRGDSLWRHVFGDRGNFAPRAKEKPLLVADPRTRRIAIVQGRSPARFDDHRGIVG